MSDYILALDQGTTSSRAILFDRQQRICAAAGQEFRQFYPQAGWVEHDAEEIWQSQYSVLVKALAKANIDGQKVAAVGITNQRETTVVWDKESGQPICPAIVWQCRRTAKLCEQLAEITGFTDHIRNATGLVLDAYFSGTKLKWILDNVDGARQKAEQGKLLFGTIDSWLIWKLTKGRSHVTDYSNAARTLLFNIHTLQWDERILQELGIPATMLPTVVDSSGQCAMAEIEGHQVPIAGIAGDQQAALFGQACFEPGMVKNTYGTGSFIIMQTGKEVKRSRNNLLTTIAWGIGGEINYALEGSVFISGAVVQWLRDELKIIGSASESESCAERVSDCNGVYLVPAFVGLGAPYWDMHARGTITGLTRGANRDHIVRAALESIAYSCRDVIDCMVDDSGLPLPELRVDGGASLNNFLMQFQADIIGQCVVRPKITETTALGAALLAGLAVGFWQSKQEVTEAWRVDRRFEVGMSIEQRKQLYRGWQKAIRCTQMDAREENNEEVKL